MPALQIASDARKNIADLKIAVLNMLKVSSNVSLKGIFGKLDFFMTELTSHNSEVDEKIFQSLGTEHIPEHLFCIVYTLFTFNRMIIKAWNNLENAVVVTKFIPVLLLTLPVIL